MMNILTNEGKRRPLRLSLIQVHAFDRRVCVKWDKLFFFFPFVIFFRCLSGGLISCNLTDSVLLWLRISAWTGADSWNIVSGPRSSESTPTPSSRRPPAGTSGETAKKNHSALDGELKSVTVSLIKDTLRRVFQTSDPLTTVISLSEQR